MEGRQGCKHILFASLIQSMWAHLIWADNNFQTVSANAAEFSKSFSYLKNSASMKYYSYEAGKMNWKEQ